MKSKAIDMTGEKVGRLTVITRVDNDKHGTSRWMCQCECGNTIIVRGGDLRRKKGTKSCGCLQKEVSRKCHTTHGKSKDRIYKIWRKMLERCNYPNHVHYKNYGGRGIRVCGEWENDFQAFYCWAISNGYEEHLTIDRIDVNGDYCPKNCRWITWKEQSNNKRNNRMITMQGKTQSVAQWCEELGLKSNTVYNRICKGWDVEKAFSQVDLRKKDVQVILDEREK